jgi:hypothetical protein
MRSQAQLYGNNAPLSVQAPSKCEDIIDSSPVSSSSVAGVKQSNAAFLSSKTNLKNFLHDLSSSPPLFSGGFARPSVCKPDITQCDVWSAPATSDRAVVEPACAPSPDALKSDAATPNVVSFGVATSAPEISAIGRSIKSEYIDNRGSNASSTQFGHLSISSNSDFSFNSETSSTKENPARKRKKEIELLKEPALSDDVQDVLRRLSALSGRNIVKSDNPSVVAVMLNRIAPSPLATIDATDAYMLKIEVELHSLVEHADIDEIFGTILSMTESSR